MRKSILSTVVMLGLAGGLSACDVEQPDPGCIVQDSTAGNWWAKFDAVDAPQGTCEGFEPLVGDELGVWKFADPVANTSILVIRPLGLAALGQFDTDSTPTGFAKLQATGNLSIDKDAEQFCTADGFTAAGVLANQGKFSAEPQDINYQFGKVRVYSNPGAPGTQMTGELTYTNNGCTAKYVMRAIWPAVGCDPSLDPNDPANAPSTCGAGSGMNPDFAVTCDPETEACTPTKAIPSFKE
ncbi:MULTISPECIES: hypothetical protein [Corallococcus]|uniref:hypothetical protein n=1 Tax=Corallococcus TaxID=83461 RepID=UPI0011C36B01|nr:MULTISPECIES: hypothetical protein [Corallococcus]